MISLTGECHFWLMPFEEKRNCDNQREPSTSSAYEVSFFASANLATSLLAKIPNKIRGDQKSLYSAVQQEMRAVSKRHRRASFRTSFVLQK
jgi:hypothetical protein